MADRIMIFCSRSYLQGNGCECAHRCELDSQARCGDQRGSSTACRCAQASQLEASRLKSLAQPLHLPACLLLLHSMQVTPTTQASPPSASHVPRCHSEHVDRLAVVLRAGLGIQAGRGAALAAAAATPGRDSVPQGSLGAIICEWRAGGAGVGRAVAEWERIPPNGTGGGRDAWNMGGAVDT